MLSARHLANAQFSLNSHFGILASRSQLEIALKLIFYASIIGAVHPLCVPPLPLIVKAEKYLSLIWFCIYFHSFLFMNYLFGKNIASSILSFCSKK